MPYVITYVITYVIAYAIMYENKIASPSSQQNPTPNIPIKLKLGLIGKGYPDEYDTQIRKHYHG